MFCFKRLFLLVSHLDWSEFKVCYAVGTVALSRNPLISKPPHFLHLPNCSFQPQQTLIQVTSQGHLSAFMLLPLEPQKALCNLFHICSEKHFSTELLAVENTELLFFLWNVLFPRSVMRCTRRSDLVFHLLVSIRWRHVGVCGRFIVLVQETEEKQQRQLFVQKPKNTFVQV